MIRVMKLKIYDNTDKHIFTIATQGDYRHFIFQAIEKGFIKKDKYRYICINSFTRSMSAFNYDIELNIHENWSLEISGT